MSQAPDYTAPILGVREWGVEEKYLSSTNRSAIWKPGEEKTATCQQDVYSVRYFYRMTMGGLELKSQVEQPLPPPGHNPPANGCGCGLYAFYDRTMCETYGDNLSTDGVVAGVRGVVSAWGDIILCDYGFKAQHMKLEAIFLEEKTIQVLGSPVSIEAAYRSLAERYGVPLILPAEVKAFSKEVGGIVLSPPEPPEETLEIGMPAGLNRTPYGWTGSGWAALSASPPWPLPGCNCVSCQAFNGQQAQTTYKEWRDKTKDIRERRS